MESINLTNTLAGLAAIQRAMAGEDILFTKLEIGDGVLTDTDVSKMTRLINKTKDYVLGAVDAEDSEIVRLRSNLSNDGVTQDLIIREYGIYAKFGNEQEFLFAYLNTGNVTTPLPSERIGCYELNRDFVLYIGNSLHVDFTSNGHLIYVSVNQYKDDMKGKANVVGTIEELKASKKYAVGDIVEVLGYKKVGDGNSHKRIITAQTSSRYGIQTANNLSAVFIEWLTPTPTYDMSSISGDIIFSGDSMLTCAIGFPNYTGQMEGLGNFRAHRLYSNIIGDYICSSNYSFEGIKFDNQPESYSNLLPFNNEVVVSNGPKCLEIDTSKVQMLAYSMSSGNVSYEYSIKFTAYNYLNGEKNIVLETILTSGNDTTNYNEYKPQYLKIPRVNRENNSKIYVDIETIEGHGMPYISLFVYGGINTQGYIPKEHYNTGRGASDIKLLNTTYDERIGKYAPSQVVISTINNDATTLTLDEFETNFKSVVEKLKSQNIVSLIVGQSLTTTYNLDRTEMDILCEAICRQEKINFFSPHNFLKDRYDFNLISVDNIHYTPYGHYIVAKEIISKYYNTIKENDFLNTDDYNRTERAKYIKQLEVKRTTTVENYDGLGNLIEHKTNASFLKPGVAPRSFVHDNLFYAGNFFVGDINKSDVPSAADLYTHVFAINATKGYPSFFRRINSVETPYSWSDALTIYGDSGIPYTLSPTGEDIKDLSGEGIGRMIWNDAKKILYLKDSTGKFVECWKAPLYKELDTPYYTLKMNEEGIYEKYIEYRDSVQKNTKTLDYNFVEVPEEILYFAKEYGVI